MVTKRNDAQQGGARVGKLKVNKETVKDLPDKDMKNVKGGWLRPPITWTCPQPTDYGSCRCQTER